MFVDGVCALAMFGAFAFQKNGSFYFLAYNFCAFALQMPFGLLLDILIQKKKIYCYHLPLITVFIGILLTLIGAVMHPAILGIGNALFHIGGGVGTIHEDRDRNWLGRGLGVFVAPGALGLYGGALLAKNHLKQTGLIAAGLCMFFLCICLLYVSIKSNMNGKNFSENPSSWTSTEISYNNQDKSKQIRLSVCCLLVVVIRSYIGMTVSFSWKTTVSLGLLAVLAIVLGKIAGGFLSARYGMVKTIVVSLTAAAVFYLYAEISLSGLGALFLFNMTMPITLYLMLKTWKQMPGFSFGCLTLALFLGYLPVYFEWQPDIKGTVIGCIGSIVSVLLLLIGMGKEGIYG